MTDTLGAALNVEEIPVLSYLAEHPGRAPFICHRIYDTSSLKQAGLSVPSTSIEKGLCLHVEGLLTQKGLV